MSEVTILTQQIQKLDEGILKENSRPDETMVFENIEDVDDESIIDQEHIGLKINTQESYKNVRVLKPSEDRSMRDFKMYASEMEVISKTRNTVNNMAI